MSHNLFLVRGKQSCEISIQTPTDITRCIMALSKGRQRTLGIPLLINWLRYECHWEGKQTQDTMQEISNKLQDGWEFGST